MKTLKELINTVYEYRTYFYIGGGNTSNIDVNFNEDILELVDRLQKKETEEIVITDLPDAKELRAEINKEKEEQEETKYSLARGAVIKAIKENKKAGHIIFNAPIPEKLQKELKEKHFKLTDNGFLDRGISIADSWRIEW
jgi:hypothetical protein